MRRICHLYSVTAILLVSALGCGQAANESPLAFQGGVAESEASGESGGELNLTVIDRSGSMEMTDDAAAKDAAGPRTERKIIYNATLDLIVADLEDVAAGVEELARKHDGFLAKSSIDTARGRPRSGSWTIRVPVTRYNEFLSAAGALGELERRTEDSREVTAEFYDLDTRIRNKRVEEERLLKHLADSTGKLEDILAVEKELSRVRTEMEQMQGQLRVLQDLTALSTVTLNAREIQGYVPVASPTFGTRIGRAWTQSLDGLLSAGKTIVIAAVFFAPWLIVIALPIVVVILLRWRLRRKRNANTRQ